MGRRDGLLRRRLLRIRLGGRGRGDIGEMEGRCRGGKARRLVRREDAGDKGEI